MKAIKFYAIIYFTDKKPIKKSYDTAAKAFFDYEDKGCTHAELFNVSGVRVSLFPNKN